MARNTRYSPELRERAVTMVVEHRSEYPSEWATMTGAARTAPDDRLAQQSHISGSRPKWPHGGHPQAVGHPGAVDHRVQVTGNWARTL